jgi:hypothetical protein
MFVCKECVDRFFPNRWPLAFDPTANGPIVHCAKCHTKARSVWIYPEDAKKELSKKECS